jgi:hypothetical protein
MSDKAKPQNNYDRLLKHLKDGSLAARLVQAHHASNPEEAAENMRVVLRERLEQVRGALDKGKD